MQQLSLPAAQSVMPGPPAQLGVALEDDPLLAPPEELEELLEVDPKLDVEEDPPLEDDPLLDALASSEPVTLPESPASSVPTACSEPVGRQVSQ